MFLHKVYAVIVPLLFKSLFSYSISLTAFADFPIVGVNHVEIVDAGLEVLENEAISPVTVESVRLMNNHISFIEEDAFR